MTVVEFEIQKNVALVTLNRPEARNAISPEVVIRLAKIWEEVRDNDEIRVAILTGEGDKAFSSGADLAKLVPLFSGGRTPEDDWDNAVMENPKLINRSLLRSFDTEKPIIAAVNGHAIAGGMELVQGTDLRVSVPNALFGVQEVKRALFPAGGSTVRLPVQLPYAKAMELLLVGDLITAQDALDWGLLNYVVPKDLLLQKAFDIASKIAKNGPLAVKAIRKSARLCLGQSEEEGMRIETRLAAPVFKTEDAIEGPRAFMEKREPVYKGR
ncbi:enoyl-CoA hydratase-related protein [Myxococcota bacterium]|nr:enoyl-CoA hydratase-related protein [Myxococcota bacterium]